MIPQGFPNLRDRFTDDQGNQDARQTHDEIAGAKIPPAAFDGDNITRQGDPSGISKVVGGVTQQGQAQGDPHQGR